jgi:hypothetical protein
MKNDGSIEREAQELQNRREAQLAARIRTLELEVEFLKGRLEAAESLIDVDSRIPYMPAQVAETAKAA